MDLCGNAVVMRGIMSLQFLRHSFTSLPTSPLVRPDDTQCSRLRAFWIAKSNPMINSMDRAVQPFDYDRLMQANLTRVFSERNPERRLVAIAELYAPDATLNEPETSVTGHALISEAVTALLTTLPAGFTFTAIGRALGHHGVGRLRWQAGPPNGPAAVTGMDIAHFQDGRIHSLYVFIEPDA